MCSGIWDLNSSGIWEFKLYDMHYIDLVKKTMQWKHSALKTEIDDKKHTHKEETNK